MAKAKTPSELRRIVKAQRHTIKLQTRSVEGLARQVDNQQHTIRQLEEKLKTQGVKLREEIGEKRLELIARVVNAQGQMLEALGHTFAVAQGQTVY